MKQLWFFLSLFVGLFLTQNAKAIDSNCVNSCNEPWNGWYTSDVYSIKIDLDSCHVMVNYRWRINCDGKYEIEYGDFYADGNCQCLDLRFHELIAMAKRKIAGAIVPQNQSYVTRLKGSCYTWYYIKVPKQILVDLGWGNEISSYDPTWNDDPIYYKMKKMVPCEESCCIAENTPIELPNGDYEIHQVIIYSGDCDGTPPSIDPIEDFVYYQNGVKHTIPCDTEIPPGGMVCEIVCTNEILEEAPNDATGLKLIDSEMVFKVYPSPFQSNLEVEIVSSTSNVATIEISTIEGKTVFSKKVDLSAGIQKLELKDLSNLTKGTYLLTIQTSSNIYTYKISK